MNKDNAMFEDEDEVMVEELLKEVKHFEELKPRTFVYVGLMDEVRKNPHKANVKRYIGHVLQVTE